MHTLFSKCNDSDIFDYYDSSEIETNSKHNILSLEGESNQENNYELQMLSGNFEYGSPDLNSNKPYGIQNVKKSLFKRVMETKSIRRKSKVLFQFLVTVLTVFVLCRYMCI